MFMASEEDRGAAVDELQELLDGNPELLNELDGDLIRLCKELGAI